MHDAHVLCLQEYAFVKKMQILSQLIRHLICEASVQVQGPEYTFTISGGYCILDKDTKSVTCVKPQVTLEKTAGTCTLKYTSPTTAFVSLLPNITVTIQAWT